jgi:hypothetical protein
MVSARSLLSLTHLIGLALGLGAATGKLTLLLKCRADTRLIPVYLTVTRPLTRLIVLGMVLLTASGLGWLLLGYVITTVLAVKLAFVLALWLLGPFIDNVVEPRFRRLAPSPGDSASADFLRAHRQYLAVEAVATGTFYLIVIIWVLR